MKHDTTFLIGILLQICSPICKYKDALKIVPVETMHSININIDCHGSDYVKLMGAKCKITQTPCKVYTGLRLILQKAGEKIGKEVLFNINTPLDIVREQDAFFKPNHNLSHKDYDALINQICQAIFKEEFRVVPIDVGHQTTFEIYPNPTEGISEALARGLDNVLYIYGNARGRKIKIECASIYSAETRAVSGEWDFKRGLNSLS